MVPILSLLALSNGLDTDVTDRSTQQSYIIIDYIPCRMYVCAKSQLLSWCDLY